MLGDIIKLALKALSIITTSFLTKQLFIEVDGYSLQSI